MRQSSCQRRCVRGSLPHRNARGSSIALKEVVEAVRDGAELALEPENKAAMDRIDEETI